MSDPTLSVDGPIEVQRHDITSMIDEAMRGRLTSDPYTMVPVWVGDMIVSCNERIDHLIELREDLGMSKAYADLVADCVPHGGADPTEVAREALNRADSLERVVHDIANMIDGIMVDPGLRHAVGRLDMIIAECGDGHAAVDYVSKLFDLGLIDDELKSLRARLSIIVALYAS